MKNLTLASLKLPLSKFFRRFHTIFFFLIIVAGLAYSVFSVTELFTKASDTTSQQTATSNSIDTSVVERIKALKPSSEAVEPVIPAGRPSPFSE